MNTSPKSVDGCSNDAHAKDKCNCGAAEHNTEVSSLSTEIESALCGGPSASATTQTAAEPTDLFDLLQSRHETMLQWCEPWPACGPEGNDLDANIMLRATVHDCINMQRRVAKEAGRKTMGDDRNHLLDFMASHWASSTNEQINRAEGGRGA